MLALFLASGACALVYETVWVRQLALSFGITIHAISAVLAAYMLGLSVGSIWIGRRATRIENPLRVYAALECGVAIYAFALHFALADALPWVVHEVHRLLPSSPLAVGVVRFVLAFLLLAPPTIAMGGTFPLLVQLFSRSSGPTGPRTADVGRLYGFNTIGAVVGALLAGFWMLKELGVLATTSVAVVANLVLAALAFRLSRRTVAPSATSRATSADATAPIASTSSEREPSLGARRLVAASVFLSGFAALSYEILWNRTLLPYTHNSTYAFSTILVVFLLGVAFGSLLFARHASRWSSLRALGVVQLLLGVAVWLSIHVTGLLPSLLARVTRVVGSDSWFAALANIACATTLVVFAPTFLMGLAFPMAVAVRGPRAHDAGARLGGLYGLATLGNILGSIVTGFVLVGTLGLRDSFAIGIACNLAVGFACFFWQPGSRMRLAVAGVLATASVALFLVVVDRDTFRRFQEKHGQTILAYREETTDTVMVVENAEGQRQIRYSDGRGTAGTNTDFTNRLYGHVPMLLHPDPKSVLSICFGVGNTLSALAQWRPQRLVCVELSPGVLDTAKWFWTNRDVLATPGLDVQIEDGRNFLLTSDEKFDVVQLEPPEMHTAGVVDLYTREFYELARSHLNAGGIVCQWMNVVLMPEHETRMLVHTMLDVFPNTTLWCGDAWWDLILVGSTEPIRADVKRMEERAASPLVRADLERLGLHGVEDLLAHHLLNATALRARVGDTPIVTDDRTFVDFSVPQSPEAGFGLFLYQTQQHVPKAKSPKRVRDRLLLLANRQSPVDLLDERSLSDSDRVAFDRALDAEVARQRKHSLLTLASVSEETTASQH